MENLSNGKISVFTADKGKLLNQNGRNFVTKNIIVYLSG